MAKVKTSYGNTVRIDKNGVITMTNKFSSIVRNQNGYHDENGEYVKGKYFTQGYIQKYTLTLSEYFGTFQYFNPHKGILKFITEKNKEMNPANFVKGYPADAYILRLIDDQIKKIHEEVIKYLGKNNQSGLSNTLSEVLHSTTHEHARLATQLNRLFSQTLNPKEYDQQKKDEKGI